MAAREHSCLNRLLSSTFLRAKPEIIRIPFISLLCLSPSLFSLGLSYPLAPSPAQISCTPNTDSSREPSLRALALLASPLPHRTAPGVRTRGLCCAPWFSCQSHCLGPLKSSLIRGAWQILPPILNTAQYWHHCRGLSASPKSDLNTHPQEMASGHRHLGPKQRKRQKPLEQKLQTQPGQLPPCQEPCIPGAGSGPGCLCL